MKTERPFQVEAGDLKPVAGVRPDSASGSFLNLRNLLILLTMGGFLLCYSGVFLSLLRQWRSNEIYSHGFLIPFISLYLLLYKRDSIAECRPKPDYLYGIPAVAFALVCLLAGRIAGILVLEEVSIVFSIAAILLLLFGRSLLRVVWFPVVYLFLMIPMWDIFTERIQHPFQILSASIGVGILKWIGIPIYRDGIFIELPGITLEVAKACSGVNYLISILAIGIPLSYVNTRRNLKRAIILFSSVVVALLSNGIRVFLVGLCVYIGVIGKNNDIHGPFHMLQALSVSFVGYLVILFLVRLLKDRHPPLRARPKLSLSAGRTILDHLHAGPLAVCTLLLAAYGVVLLVSMPVASPLKKDIGVFPYVLGDWKGKDEAFALSLYHAHQADRELFRTYQSAHSDPVRLYVGYYELQNQGKELIDYRSDFLFDRSDTIELRMDSGETVKINRHVAKGRNSKIVSLYWIQVDHRILLDKYSEKYATLMNAFLHRKTNGSVVIVSMEVPDDRDDGPAVESQADFVRRVYPVLQEYLP